MPSVNPYKPHLMILPEDQANEEIANGFHLHHGIAYERIRVLPPARGWRKVVDDFHSEWADTLLAYPDRYFVLVVDLDRVATRVPEILRDIPPILADRVFVIGAFAEPEDLKGLGSFENIGRKLADDCFNSRSIVWDHPLLVHNKAEVRRLRDVLGRFAFR